MKWYLVLRIADPNQMILRERLFLSRCEAAVLFWIAHRKTGTESATILSISRRTVNKHLEHVYLKLGVESRVGAAALAWRTLSSPAARRASR